MKSLRVAKIEVSASLYLANSTVIRGTVFLAEFSATHSGRETMLDLLRYSEPMLPMRDLSGRFVLIGRRQIVGAECAPEFAGAGDLADSGPVEIDMTGGHVFTGNLLKPPGLSDRVSDSLNDHFEFHAIEATTAIIWTNRKHIVKAKTDN